MTDTPRTDAERLAEELEAESRGRRLGRFVLVPTKLLREAAALLRARRGGAPQEPTLRSLAAELCEAAFDYHVHSELHPSVEGVEKTVRLLNARHAVQAELDKGEPSPRTAQPY